MNMRAVSTFVAFAATIAVAASYLYGLGMRLGPPAHRTNLSMTIADANSLVAGSNVLLRGVSVGKVTSVETSISDVTVHFYVDSRFHVPVDTEVRVDNLSALGEAYIGFFPQTTGGPMLYDGQRIAKDKVTLPATISDVVAAAVRVLGQVDRNAVQRIIDEVDTALPAPDAVLPNLSRTGMLLKGTAAGMHGRGAELLGNLQSLLHNAEWVPPVLTAATTTAIQFAEIIRPMFVSIVDLFNGMLKYDPHPETSPGGYGRISVGVDKIFALMNRIQGFLDTASPDIKVLSEAMLPHMQGVAGALMNFDSRQILSNMLAAIPEDGTISLHVAIPEK